jgi:NAD(P)-dependent dehydrogenase (short-subunit alcohol dehydrogenase family)
VQACAKAFLAKETRLDILICNAGVMALPAGLTKDGYEVQFGTNHVGHALLVKLLLPTLVSTAELPGADVRVVAVSSLAHLWCPSAGIAFEELKTEMQGSTTWARYGQSKLANILFAAQLAKRYPKVLAVSVHPGTVDTDLYIPFMGRNRVVGWLNALTKSFHLVSVETGALNQLWAATAGREEVKTGEYYTPVGKMGTRSNFSKDEKLAERLWEWTEKELEGYTL